MGYVCFLLVLWLNILFFKKKGYFISALAFLWMAYLGWSANPMMTFDYVAYQNIYNRTAMGINVRVEWLYTLCSKLSIRYGLTYEQFRMLFLIVVFLLLYIAIVRLTNYPAFFAGFFLIVPFFQEVTQVRSFAAYTMVLVGLSCLAKKRKRSLMIYFIAVIIAMGFHTSAGIYLMVPLVEYMIERIGLKKVFEISIWTSLLVSVVLVIFQKSTLAILVIAKLIEIVAGNVISNTFITLMGSSGGSKWYFLIIWGLYILITYLILRMMFQESLFLKEKSINVLFSVVIIGILLCPTLLLSTQFNRIQRFGIEVVILLMSIFASSVNIRSTKNTHLIVVTSLLVLLIGGGFYGLYSPGDSFILSIPYLTQLQH